MAAVLVVAYALTGPRSQQGAAFRAGAADAARILDGESWRTMTALTLHADAAHLVGNAAAGALLGTAVCRALGAGVGAALIVASGVAGNALNAWVRGGPHVSVGASTAVMGAIGVLSGLAFVRARRARRRRMRAWLPLAAGLGLLAMLGADPRSDLGAHAFGFVCGIAFGAMVGRWMPAVPGRPVQWPLALALLALTLAAWWRALRP